MREFFDKFSDKLERYCGHWSSVFVFTVLFVIFMLILGVDITNIIVSYVTAGLLFLSLGKSRREMKAIQVKLDDLLLRNDDMDDDIAGLEEKQEEEIDEIKDHIYNS